MRREDLQRALRLGEWRDLEFKEARNHAPRSSVETVAAFANTSGGTLVFGVSEVDGRYVVTGVEQPDKVQNDFLSMLHSEGKLSHDVTVIEQRMIIDGQVELAQDGNDVAGVPSLSQVCPKSVPTTIAALVLAAATEPIDARALMESAGQTNRTRFREHILKPLISAGLLALTRPDKPTSSKQQYILTNIGRQIMRLNDSEE